MTPGQQLGQFVARAADTHFEEELQSYCIRHGQRPEDLNIDLQPYGANKIKVTLGPKEKLLILPRRVFVFSFSMKGPSE